MPRRRLRPRIDASGFGSLELLVATAAALMLLAGLAGFARSHARLFAQHLAALDVGETGRRALEAMAREIRVAGFDPLPGDFDGRSDGIAFAGSERIELRSDLHGASGGDPPDGTIDLGSDERVGFYRSAARRLLYQTLGDQSLPLSAAGWLPSGALAFRFFDACGRELVPPSGESLPLPERAAVQRVAIALRLEDGVGDDFSADTAVVLRNRASVPCS